MEGASRKRPYPQDLEDDDDKPPKQKRVRFPKGKKVKAGEEKEDNYNNRPTATAPTLDTKEARLAALERAKRRNLITAQLFSDDDDPLASASASEVIYQENENFVQDGIQIEPFNLDTEREQGYFDAQGNFVQYLDDKQIKDAWLDSIDLHPPYAGLNSAPSSNLDNEKDAIDLTSEDIGIIKKSIASLLEPGETVLQALRRFKGGSNKRKEKMSTETQLLFDKLTEDANKLLEHGEYNVYHDKQEVFKREAEGYEKLALVRGKDISLSIDLSSDVTNLGASSSILSNSGMGVSNSNAPAADTSNNDDDGFDMFGDDDDNMVAKPSSDSSNLASGSNSSGVTQSSSESLHIIPGSGDLQDDYVYDETSGYYYSSNSGYYYDASTGLYCYAASGQWYSYNGETGRYDEIPEAASNANGNSA
ncbi:CD2-binding protein-related [Euphorbia peplus]|nr:CD2-binding protein-related [Euphorbia peplus]